MVNEIKENLKKQQIKHAKNKLKRESEKTLEKLVNKHFSNFSDDEKEKCFKVLMGAYVDWLSDMADSLGGVV